MNIVSVVQKSGLELKRTGSKYVALCPFHKDKDTPSLTIYPTTNSWYCFGKCSSSGGDSIQFVRERFGYNYQEALDWIGHDHQEPVSFNIKKKPARIVPHKAVVYWHNFLDKKRRKWFYGRGFKDEIIDREMWGFDGLRYCIPIWEGEPGNSNCLGVRKRKQDGREGSKYIGIKGMNPPTIWGRWYCKDRQQLVVVFDKKEESFGGRLASDWNRTHGSMTAKVFHYQPDNKAKDYCEYRDSLSAKKFRKEVLKFTGININNSILAFAGELDAARAIQDGYQAFSLVNGINALSTFPEDWVEKWF